MAFVHGVGVGQYEQSPTGRKRGYNTSAIDEEYYMPTSGEATLMAEEVSVEEANAVETGEVSLKTSPNLANALEQEGAIERASYPDDYASAKSSSYEESKPILEMADDNGTIKLMSDGRVESVLSAVEFAFYSTERDRTVYKIEFFQPLSFSYSPGGPWDDGHNYSVKELGLNGKGTDEEMAWFNLLDKIRNAYESGQYKTFPSPMERVMLKVVKSFTKDNQVVETEV